METATILVEYRIPSPVVEAAAVFVCTCKFGIARGSADLIGRFSAEASATPGNNNNLLYLRQRINDTTQFRGLIAGADQCLCTLGGVGECVLFARKFSGLQEK